MSNLDMPSLLSRSSEAFNGGTGYPSASDLSMFSSSLPTLFHEKRMFLASLTDQSFNITLGLFEVSANIFLFWKNLQ